MNAVIMQDFMNNPQAKPEIYLERSGAGDGRSQHRNYGEPPPRISTVPAAAGAGAEHRPTAPEPGARHQAPSRSRTEPSAAAGAGAGPEPEPERRADQRPEPGPNPGEGVPEPNPGGPNRGWDSAVTEAVDKITSPQGYQNPAPKF